MRFLVKVNFPNNPANALAKGGKLAEIIQSILADQKAEAAYFTDNKGMRTGFIVLNMQDASQIVAISEPWFLALNAAIEIHPVMVPEDLDKGREAMEQAAKKYG